MVVETETIQLFQSLWLSREFARLKAMTEKVHSHVLQCSNVSDKRLLTAYMKIPSSQAGSIVVWIYRLAQQPQWLTSIESLIVILTQITGDFIEKTTIK